MQCKEPFVDLQMQKKKNPSLELLSSRFSLLSEHFQIGEITKKIRLSNNHEYHTKNAIS